MEIKTILGLDIGGTSIKSGIVQDKKLISTSEKKTNSKVTDSVIKTIYSIIREASKDKIDAIGIGIPGFINEKTGIIEHINNIPAFCGINLVEIIQKEFNMKVRINNDANCFALGEYHFGAYQKLNNVIGLTLGTGLGGGIIIDKKLYSGLYGGAGEFGCIPYQGQIFEYFCSNNFFKVFYNYDGKTMFNKASDGNRMALNCFYNFGLHLGNLMNQILLSFAPEAIIIGGKIANAFELFMPGIKHNLKNYPVDFIQNKVKISKAIVREPGIVGAASLWL